MLTSGILDFALESRFQGYKKLDTPQLAQVRYQTPDASQFLHQGLGFQRETAGLKGKHMRSLIVAGLLLAGASGAMGQSRRFTVAIGGVMHESNSFNPAKTTVSDFEGNARDQQSFRRGSARIVAQE